MKRTARRIITTAAIALTGLLAACAQYQVRTSKALNYSVRVERIFVWSANGTVSPLGIKRKFQGDSFENLFHAALKRSLEGANLIPETRAFVPNNDTMESLARFEQDFRPNARLLIQPKRYQTVTYAGNTGVTGLWLDLSLYDVTSGRRVWRGELFLDPALDVGAWGEAGAGKLAEQIVEALRKDRLI